MMIVIVHARADPHSPYLAAQKRLSFSSSSIHCEETCKVIHTNVLHNKYASDESVSVESLELSDERARSGTGVMRADETITLDGSLTAKMCSLNIKSETPVVDARHTSTGGTSSFLIDEAYRQLIHASVYVRAMAVPSRW